MGRDHGRRQPPDARRRLDGGRPPRLVREDGARRRPPRHGRRVPAPGRRQRRRARARRHARGRPGRPFLRLRPHHGALPRRLLRADDLRLAQPRDLGGGRPSRRATMPRTGSTRRRSKPIEEPPMEPAIGARSSTPSSPSARPRAASRRISERRPLPSRSTGVFRLAHLERCSIIGSGSIHSGNRIRRCQGRQTMLLISKFLRCRSSSLAWLCLLRSSAARNGTPMRPLQARANRCQHRRNQARRRGTALSTTFA